MIKKLKPIKFKTSIIILGVLAILGLIALSYSTQRNQYMSDNPLFGSFSIENGNLDGQTYPTDFLVSIDVPTKHKELVICAERAGIDLSNGCWVYCFAENQVYTAIHDGMKLNVFDEWVVVDSWVSNVKITGSDYRLKKVT